MLPGKKMPGRMGGQQVTTQNVKVLKVDEDKGIIVLSGMTQFLSLSHALRRSMRFVLTPLIPGCVSGPDGCVVKIQDALKKPWPVPPPSPPTAQEAAEPLRATA